MCCNGPPKPLSASSTNDVTSKSPSTMPITLLSKANPARGVQRKTSGGRYSESLNDTSPTLRILPLRQLYHRDDSKPPLYCKHLVFSDAMLLISNACASASCSPPNACDTTTDTSCKPRSSIGIVLFSTNIQKTSVVRQWNHLVRCECVPQHFSDRSSNVKKKTTIWRVLEPHQHIASTTAPA